MSRTFLLPVLATMLLPVLVTPALAAGRSPAAQGTPAAPAVPAVRAGRVAPEMSAADLRLFVSHRRTEGRLVVKVGTQAVLSAPFSAIKPGANGWFERPLSVESGRQTVTVLVIDGAGRLVAQQSSEAVLAAAGTATLAVAEHGGTGKGLTLEWRTP